MKEISLYKLYSLKEQMEELNITYDPIYKTICERIKEREFLIETDGGSSINSVGGGGMGDVINSQPSSLAGSTIGPNWSSNGGSLGSGDVSFPYNPGGSNRMQQKMGLNHGSRTGKKSRTKKLDLKSIKNIMSRKQDYTSGEGRVKEPTKKVMNFQDFLKNDFTTIKK